MPVEPERPDRHAAGKLSGGRAIEVVGGIVDPRDRRVTDLWDNVVSDEIGRVRLVRQTQSRSPVRRPGIMRATGPSGPITSSAVRK